MAKMVTAVKSVKIVKKLRIISNFRVLWVLCVCVCVVSEGKNEWRNSFLIKKAVH